MSRRRRVLRRWLIGYVALLLGTLPLALPLWNGVLREAIGPYVSIPQIHLAQYAGLGWLAAMYVRAGSPSARAWAALVALLAGLSLLDEVVQWALPNRYFDWADVGLNVAGGLGGIVLHGMAAWAARGRALR